MAAHVSLWNPAVFHSLRNYVLCIAIFADEQRVELIKCPPFSRVPVQNVQLSEHH